MKNGLLVFLLLLLSFAGYGQTCTLSVSISSNGTTICSGSSLTITAVPTAGKAPYTFVWSTGETTPSISVNKAATYTVTVSDKTPGCSPVPATITITSIPGPAPPTAGSQVICRNTSAMLTATAPGGVYQWYDAPTGGNFLVSGNTYTTPPLSTTAVYYVQTTLGGCTSARTAVNVIFPADPIAPAQSTCSNNTATLTATGGDTYNWYDVPSGANPPVGTGPSFTTPILNSSTTYYVEATTKGCVSSRVPVKVTVNAAPPSPTIGLIPTTCAGSIVTLHASSPAGVIDWFDVPTGGTSLISSPDFTTPALSVSTIYYVQTTLNGCSSSPRIPVTVNVTPLPADPVVPLVPAICVGSSAAITPTGPAGVTFDWFSVPAGGSILFTGNTFNTPALNSTTTYYVRSNNGCGSNRVPVTVTVNQPPAAPSAESPLICSGNTATLTAFAPGGVYQWYDAPVGGNLLATNISYTTPALLTTTIYYVQTTLGGCTSPRAAVTVTILPIPVAPTVAPVAPVCSGSFATLTASGATGSYDWYDAATGGNYLSSGQVFITPPLAVTTTFYVQNTTTGCPSNRTPITVTVNATPVAPSISSVAPICPSTTATLTASAPGGTIQWYSAPSGGSLLGSGNTFITPIISSATTYYAQNTVGTCVGPRASVTVNIIPVTTPQFKYSSGTFCASGSNPSPVINNPSGGTFSASPAGLVFVSNTTGQINIGASTPGNYIISFAGLGACPRSTSATISIVTTPNAQFSYSGPFCNDAVDPLPAFPAGSSAGVFTASPAGLVFKNSSTGEIDLAASAANTYTVTNTIAASGSCLASVVSAPVTINAAVIISAGPPQTVPTGGTVQLAGSISGGATTGTWLGGTGTFSNPNLLNAVYTPGPGETSVTLTLLSADPPGPCGPNSAQVTITVHFVPGAPVAASTSICAGNAVTLSATAPGGAYQWYDAFTGGNLLNSGPNFTTPPLNATTTYYVQTTVSGVTSTRTPVTVTVNTVPAQPVVSGTTTICAGNTTTLTASGSSGTYEWYDLPIGGNLLSTSSTFTTPVLTSNGTYYLEADANGCASARLKVDLIVNPVPGITSAGSNSTCSGIPVSYNITADIATATFNWSRAAVAGISNPALSNQSTAVINETLINTTNAPVNVTYVIIPTVGMCSGIPFNYVVTVDPIPSVTSSSVTTPICSGTSDNYTITFNTPGTISSWSRAAVPGITNAAVSGQASTTINEVLFNTSNAPIDVTYIFTYGTGNCGGLSFPLVITVNPNVVVTSSQSGTACSGTPENYVITSNIPSATFTWSRAAVLGNPAVSGQTSGTINETLINAGANPVGFIYHISAIANGCQGPDFVYSVLLQPAIPPSVANSNSPVCVGSTIQLQTAIVPNATYLWTGPNGFSSPLQNPPVDANNVSIADAGTYNLFVTVNGCTNPPVSTVVVVDPPAIVDVGNPIQTLCNNVASVQLTGSVTGGTTTGVWSKGSATGTFSPSINALNGQYIPSAQDLASGSVKLTLTSTSKDDCNPQKATQTIIFEADVVTSKAVDAICTGLPQNYVMTAILPGSTFSWDRAAVPGISNAPVFGQTSPTITEALVNTTTASIIVTYIITPSLTGCTGTPFSYNVTVYPQPVAPVPDPVSPVCVGSTIQLSVPTVAGATYAWLGPNGFVSPLQNPTIPAATSADAGPYTVTISVNGCPSPPGTVNVLVVQPPVVDAGKPQTACIDAVAVPLAGTSSTGAGTWAPVNGTGTFSPSNAVLNASYLPSAADETAGAVTLRLSSANGCTTITSDVTITFQQMPGIDAGGPQTICSEDAATLNGQNLIPGGGGGVIWKSSGTGIFSPSATQVVTHYIPSAADIKNGSVVLTLDASLADKCYISTDQMVLTLAPPPTVNAGGTRYVLKGHTITLNPTVSDDNVTYLWAPDNDISDNTVKNPVVTGDVDVTYTLTVTDSRGCTNSDKASIIVSPEIVIPNAFSPNNDGINDLWNIKGLDAYQQATLDVFDRYGQKVFHSVAYAKPWDGTVNGKQVPFGTYYYIIDTKMYGQVISGYITVLR